ncbi:MAG: SPOR domain-containing protein [Gemmatimonadota bacterium]
MDSERDGGLRAATRLPADARIIALLSDEVPGLSRAVVEVATGIAEQRGRTLVLGLGVAGEALDEGLGTADAPGLAEVLSGEAKLTDVTHRSPERRFLYLPLGGSSEPPSPSGIRSLIERVRAAGGTLLVVMAGDRGGLPAEWFDMDLEIAGLAAPSSPPARPDSMSADTMSVGSMPEDAMPAVVMPAVAMPAEAMLERGRWGRHKLKQRLPLPRFAVAGAALVALLAGWWLLARVVTRSSTEGTLPAAAVSTEAIDVGIAAGDGSASAEDQGEASTEREGGPSAEALMTLADAVAAGTGPELPFSVLVASYARRSDAFARARGVSDGSILFFVVPTQVREKTYHRLFAGALPTRDSARVLMGELMGRGIKEAISNWDIRPASLGYLLSVHASRDAARAAERELLESGIWAYTIPLVAAGDTVHQVYAGAYERSEAAAALRAQLTEAGVDAELVPRRGEPR